LGPFGASHTWLDVGKIELQNLAVYTLIFARNAKHILGLEIVSECVDLFIGPTGCFEVTTRFLIDREKAHGRPIFRSHIGESRAVGQRQVRGTFAMVLNKLAHHFCCPQHLGAVQD
jgi:hypothetical protein